MRIDHLGKVGIGTTNPDGLLHTYTASSVSRVLSETGDASVADHQFKNSGGSAYFGLGSAGEAYIDARGATGDIRLKTSAGTTRLIVTSTGNIGIGTTEFGTNAAKVLGLHNGTAPTTSPADLIQLYAVDYVDGDGTATSELFVRDEDGSTTDLSPHIFALYQPDTAEPFPWSYYAENSYLGKRINVDMAGAIRAIERLSGKQFIFYRDLPRADLQKEKREEWKEDWIGRRCTVSLTRAEVGDMLNFQETQIQI